MRGQNHIKTRSDVSETPPLFTNPNTVTSFKPDMSRMGLVEKTNNVQIRRQMTGLTESSYGQQKRNFKCVINQVQVEFLNLKLKKGRKENCSEVVKDNLC
jgi:hypothetical protein